MPYGLDRPDDVRVLVAAGDEDTRSMLTFLMRAEGFHVYCIEEVRPARIVLQLCQGPATVIMDDAMPAATLAQWMQMLAGLRHVRCILLSRRPADLPLEVLPLLGQVASVVMGTPLCINALVSAVADAGLPGKRRDAALVCGNASGGPARQRSVPAFRSPSPSAADGASRSASPSDTSSPGAY